MNPVEGLSSQENKPPPYFSDHPLRQAVIYNTAGASHGNVSCDIDRL
jgi:hypothetical protein